MCLYLFRGWGHEEPTGYRGGIVSEAGGEPGECDVTET